MALILTIALKHKVHIRIDPFHPCSNRFFYSKIADSGFGDTNRFLIDGHVLFIN